MGKICWACEEEGGRSKRKKKDGHSVTKEKEEDASEKKTQVYLDFGSTARRPKSNRALGGNLKEHTQ